MPFMNTITNDEKVKMQSAIPYPMSRNYLYDDFKKRFFGIDGVLSYSPFMVFLFNMMLAATRNTIVKPIRTSIPCAKGTTEA